MVIRGPSLSWLTDPPTMTIAPLPGPLVPVRWLADNLPRTDLVVLDASLSPVAGNAPPPAFQARGIPGARVFDLDGAFCDWSSGLPHMMPTPEVFAAGVRALGVSTTSTVIAYDRMGLHSSPRAWRMFLAMGHDWVAVLDGGLPAWLASGQATEPLEDRPVTPGDFVAHPRPGRFCDADRVARALTDEACAVLDARSADRFAGRAPEPRPGLRAGHMPGAVNLPFTSVLNQGHLLTAPELAALFRPLAGAQQEWIFTCGSGVTACILALAAEVCGHRRTSVYDGSWSEWAAGDGRPSLRPIVTGQ